MSASPDPAPESRPEIWPEPRLSTEQQMDDVVLPAPVEEVVTSWKVACDGDVAAGLGHPRVWLVISPETGWADCGYCDKRFVIDKARAPHDH